jgi:hypothetical protein
LNTQQNVTRPMYQAPGPYRCTSTRIGTQVYTNCY